MLLLLLQQQIQYVHVAAAGDPVRPCNCLALAHALKAAVLEPNPEQALAASYSQYALERAAGVVALPSAARLLLLLQGSQPGLLSS
jgi:hypothetical protein